MTKEKLFKECDACGGLGYEEGTAPISGEPIQTPCNKCEGSGKISLGSLDLDLVEDIEDMKDKINDILDKVNNIFEKVNE